MKIQQYLLFLVVLSSTSLWAADGVLSGSGTEADPYLIEDVNDLQAFSNADNQEMYWSEGVHTRLAIMEKSPIWLC